MEEGGASIFGFVNEQRKAAYRHLLYVAMLDIRNRCQPRGEPSMNPMVWRKGYLNGRVAGSVADWLHNLAAFSAKDFMGFDENHFWREGEMFLKRLPEINFREIFEEHIRGNCRIC